MARPDSVSKIPPDVEDDPNEVARAWSSEVERRVREIREGKAKTFSSEEVFADLDALDDEDPVSR